MIPTAVRRHGPVTVEVIVALAIAFVVGLLVARDDSPKPGAVDVGFSQDMAVHHEQAVLMAQLAQTRGGPAVRELAGAILVNQSQEIGMLRGWLRAWGKPAASDSPMSWMGSMHMAGMATAMPGMASSAQLRELDDRTGKAFDALFLQLMIRHHEGGIEMAQYAEQHANLGMVRDAARAMAVAQIEDIALMRPLLRADGAPELPAP